MRSRIVALATFLVVVIFFAGARRWRQNAVPYLEADKSASIEESYVFKGPNATDKIIVMAKMESENTDWVGEELPDWQQAIYHMDDIEWVLHPPVNKGREAMAYLTFLISHYEVLPEIILFLHPHRNGWPEAWHNDAADYDNVLSIQSLKLDYVREHGYANMRCNPSVGCPSEIQPFRNDTERPSEQAFADAYMYMFQSNLSNVPDEVGTPCCSQFAVSREQVMKRPVSDYQRYRTWLLETELDDAASGRVMEYSWHLMFGKEPVWCPPVYECYCDQFDRC